MMKFLGLTILYGLALHYLVPILFMPLARVVDYGLETLIAFLCLGAIAAGFQMMYSYFKQRIMELERKVDALAKADEATDDLKK